MVRYKLSIRDLYNAESTLFDNLTLPTGMSKPNLINILMKESDWFNVSSWYSKPSILKSYMADISERYSRKWQHLWDIFTAEYEAIYNYDMVETEHYEDEHSEDTTRDIDYTNSETVTATAQVNTYNSDAFHDDSKTTTTDVGSDTTDESSTWDGTKEYDRTLTRKGNIGVTTTQQMMESEIELWNKLDVYGIVAKDIIGEICIMIYN